MKHFYSRLEASEAVLCLLAGHRQEPLLWAFSDFRLEGPEIPRINLLTQSYEVFTELTDTQNLETGWFVEWKEKQFWICTHVSEGLPGCRPDLPLHKFLQYIS